MAAQKGEPRKKETQGLSNLGEVWTDILAQYDDSAYLYTRSRSSSSNGQAFGDGWRTKHGIISVMWIAIPFQENDSLLQNNVKRYASWILVFLDILKNIGNSWKEEGMRKGFAPNVGPDLNYQSPVPYLETF